ncbi:MAG TPA: hydroxymethylbilane synthase [Planctomycetes bacterium]|nr:hydroxymethylbilane synthase [Planctomycetota bacterium]HIJ70701.1 hydroxymethylbilane synthase [Planctomycetota bacterium]
MKTLVVATRGSRLALAQTNIVIDALKKTHPDVNFEIKRITTKGDKQTKVALWQLSGFGFFTRQVEEALLAGEADIAVHSFKDMPTEKPEGLTIAAVSERFFPQDCFVSNKAAGSLDEVPEGAKIGTSSFRRIAQIKQLRGDLQTTTIRGNVQTRLSKVQSGQLDAVILARAGLERLGLAEVISFSFDPLEFIPAPAQGALAVQTRSDDPDTNRIASSINHAPTRLVVSAERRVLAALHPGCHAPVGVFAKITGSDIMITAFVSDIEGKVFLHRKVTGPNSESELLADRIADELVKDGAARLLENLKPK